MGDTRACFDDIINILVEEELEGLHKRGFINEKVAF